MREIIRRYNEGEVISATEFNNGGLDFFSDVVYPMALKEQATRQLGFDGDVYYRRVHPLGYETPQQERLKRPVELTRGVTQIIDTPRKQSDIDRFDNDLESVRLTQIREELKDMARTIPTRREILETKEHLKDVNL